MNHTIHEKPHKNLLRSGIGFIVVAILIFIFWKDYTWFIDYFFLLFGLYYLIRSNIILKNARLELNENALLFFNQLNIKYKTIPLSNISGTEFKEDQMILNLPRNYKKALTDQVYQRDQLTTLREKLTEQGIQQK